MADEITPQPPPAETQPPPAPDRPIAPTPLFPPERRAKREIVSDWEKQALYLFFAIVVIVVGLMQWREATAQAAQHQGVIDFVKHEFAAGHLTQTNYLEVTTSEGMIGDLTALRHAGLFFGIIAMALGCILVMTGIESGYQLSLDSPEVKGTLHATSPGLVLITLGVVLALAALYRNTNVSLRPDDGHPTTTAQRDTPPATKPTPAAHPEMPGAALTGETVPDVVGSGNPP